MSPASREVIPSGLKLSRSPASVEIKGQQGTHPTGLQSTEAREEDHRRVRANGVRALASEPFHLGSKSFPALAGCVTLVVFFPSLSLTLHSYKMGLSIIPISLGAGDYIK